MRVTEDNSKIISEILVEINGSTGVHVHCGETDPGEYYKFFLKNEEKVLLFNPLKPELNPICYLLTLLGSHHFLHVSRIRVKSLTLRQLRSYIYIYGAPILDVSRSHTTTHHSR